MPQKIGINISGYYAWYWYDTLNALWSLRMSVNCHPMGSNTLKYSAPCHAIKTQQSRVVQKEGGGSMWSQCQPAKHLSPHVTLSFEVTYYNLWHRMIGWLSAEDLINTVSTRDCSTCITPSPTQSVIKLLVVIIPCFSDGLCCLVKYSQCELVVDNYISFYIRASENDS